MANLTETESFDVGVYRIETTDPVQGGEAGVSNKAAKNLANRTAWLKKTLDALVLAATKFANLDSPALTGTPTAPTPAIGDKSTKLATTEFVQNTTGTIFFKSVAGNANVTLTALEAGYGIISLTGVLTGNISVIFPRAGQWIITHNTTGPFTVTLRNATGPGLVLTQGRIAHILADGAGLQLATTDFNSTAFIGAPTAPTPAKFDVSTRLATMAALQAAGLRFSAVRDIQGTTALVLTAADAGSLVQVGGSGGSTVTLPLASSVPRGALFTLSCYSNVTGFHTIRATASDLLSDGFGGGAPAATLRGGDTITYSSDGLTTWLPVADFTAGRIAKHFSTAASIGYNGFQILPGGLIMQWGTVITDANGLGNAVFPIAFPNLCTSFVANHIGGGAAMVTIMGDQATRFSHQVLIKSLEGAVGVWAARWVAFGY